MGNRDIETTREYHQATKHSPQSVRAGRHELDWANKPSPFKFYPALKPIPLPTDLPQTGVAALEAIAATDTAGDGETIPNLSQLAHILYYSAGVTKKLIQRGGEIYFRAASCAGALYPIEIYVVCGDLQDLEGGVYHFNPADFALRRLRAGDHRRPLSEASADQPSVRSAPVTLVCTAITWRSSWKYRARSYRYHFWDTGTILANALAAAAANDLSAEIVMGFVDDEVHRLLGVDGRREKSLCLVPLGSTASAPPAPPNDVPALDPDFEPLSREQVEYPIIEEMHTASQLGSPERVATWREGTPESRTRSGQGERFPLQPLEASSLPAQSIEDTIVQRGSARRFWEEPVSFAELSTMLDRATRGLPADWSNSPLNNLYVNVHAVEGLPAGSYVFHPRDGTLEQLQPGNFRGESAAMCLWQDLGGTASATVFFLADLEPVLETYGNRGYRVAQMEAGIIGGKLYLGAYALDRGASGLTFFDDATVDFFSPHASGKDAIFVTALGEPASPRQRRGRLVRVEPGKLRE